MPSFFAFQQGAESRGHGASDSSPLLGRFRAVPAGSGRRAHRNSFLDRLSGSASYGSLGRSVGDVSGDGDTVDWEDEGYMQRCWRGMRDLWLEPKHHAVGRVVDNWWSRWAVLAVLPAAVVSSTPFFPLHRPLT